MVVYVPKHLRFCEIVTLSKLFVLFLLEMEYYSSAEYTDIHFMYGVADGNARLAARLYAERFPNRRHPSHKVFVAVHNRLRESGQLKGNMNVTGRPRSVRNVRFEEAILQQIEENPSTSTRAIAQGMFSTKSTVWNVLHEQLFHPFKLQKVQALEPRDYPYRVECCRWFLHKEVDSPNFLRKVLFTDEASFNRQGIFNSKNNHIWAQENPHSIIQRGHQVRFSVNVWAGVLDNFLIGPYILPNRLNTQAYTVFLRDVLPELLEDIPLEVRQGMWFQHDGAPAHFANEVQNYLNVAYANQWIGRGGPVAWPARSPDLNPLDFYVWGQMKQLVYSTPVVDEMNLVARIVEAGAVIQESNRFEEVRQSLLRRFRICNGAGGGHFENLL